ncbi:MAG: bacillithiol system redox-active protein YtxJ [Flavobacterium sp.]
MSLFSTIFGSSDEQNELNNTIIWIPLTFMGQLDELVALSEEKPALILKHSTRCSVSRFVLKQFEKDFDLKEKVDTYFLDLLEHRDISNEIATRFNVQHQSPQLLLIKNGKVVYHVSHEDISAQELEENL